MTIQLTFVRGNYSGAWREDHPDSRSGSLEILFKGKWEITFHDKAEHAAEKVFASYAEPDWHHLAEQIVDNFLHNDVPLSVGLKAVGKDDRHIERDIDVVRGIMKTLITNEGYDPRDLSVFDFDDED